MNLKHLTSQFSQDQHKLKMLSPANGSFPSTFGCSVTTEECFKIPSALNIYHSVASKLIVNKVHLVDIYNSLTLSITLMNYKWIRVTPAEAQSESILLSTSEEEQPEDRSQPPKR